MIAVTILALGLIGIIGLVPFMVQLVRLRIGLGEQKQSVAIILFDCVLYAVLFILLSGISGMIRYVLGIPELPPKFTLVFALLFAFFPWIFMYRLLGWKEHLDDDQKGHRL